MNGAHLHLLVNHLPVLGVLFGAALLVAGLWRRSATLIRAGLVTFVAAGIGAGLAYLTGEPAEEVVERAAGVSEAALELHEETAVYALAGGVGLGLLSLAGLVLTRRAAQPMSRLGWGMLLLALAVGGITAWTANTGGRIRHPEVGGALTAAADREDAGGEREREGGREPH